MVVAFCTLDEECKDASKELCIGVALANSVEDLVVAFCTLDEECKDVSKELCVGVANAVEESDTSYGVDASLGLVNSSEDSTP